MTTKIETCFKNLCRIDPDAALSFMAGMVAAENLKGQARKAVPEGASRLMVWRFDHTKAKAMEESAWAVYRNAVGLGPDDKAQATIEERPAREAAEYLRHRWDGWTGMEDWKCGI